jgi:hypothetical protein
MGQCTSPTCNNSTEGNRAKCNTCRSRDCRLRDPVRYFLNNLRESARKRGIYFDLELEEFRAWAIKQNFRFYSGDSRAKTDSVDRIENDKGYIIKNIQKLTVSQNAKKYNTHDKHGKQWKPVIDSPEF